MSAPLPDLRSLLAAHGLEGATGEPIAHAGYSGSALTRLRRGDGASFVLKRMAIDRDWIMRATDDVHCREVALAVASPPLPGGVRTPNIGTARDGDGYALIMRDISDDLLPPESIIDAATLDTILRRVADLHASPVPEDVLPWCDLARRLALLTPGTMQIAASYGAPVARAVTDGWRLFERHAPPDVVAFITQLWEDPSPLVRALRELPPAWLHGDLKFDNIGIDKHGRLRLIDWSMTLVAPAAVDLGWFLAINSRRLTVSLDDVMARYADIAALPDGVRARHDALTVLCGLLLRGWRKALDAEEGEPEELCWWCDRAREAAAILSS